MVDALFECLDVAVKHRAGTPAAHSVPNTMNVEPFLGGFFAATDFVAHFRIENFGAATGDGAESVFTQKRKCLGNRNLKDSLRQMAHFNGGESFNVEGRVESAQSAQQVEIPFSLQGGMQTTDHVHFGNSQGQGLGHSLNNLGGSVLESVCVAFLGSKGAK